MTRYELTDRQWQHLGPLLPPERPPSGRPNHHHRTILNGILWVLRTGAPWRDLPERYGPVGTVSSRFYRWCQSGLWQRILSALQAQADARGEIDWGLHFVEATIVRAHQHAVGARRAGAVGGRERLRGRAVASIVASIAEGGPPPWGTKPLSLLHDPCAETAFPTAVPTWGAWMAVFEGHMCRTIGAPWHLMVVPYCALCKFSNLLRRPSGLRWATVYCRVNTLSSG